MTSIATAQYFVNGKTPLFHAVSRNRRRTAEDLLKYGADVHQMTAHRRSPIYFAVLFCDENMCSLLLRYGADVQAHDTTGSTILHKAVERKDYGIVALLLSKGAKVNKETKKGVTPLNIGAQRANTKICELLIKAGANPNIYSDLNEGPLYHAVCRKKYNIAELLLMNKADVDKKTWQDSTPMHVACRNNDQKTCELLLEFAPNLNCADHTGATPLHLSVGNSNLELTELLLSKGADVNSKNKDEVTPIHIAASLGNKKICEALLKSGAKINVCDKNGNSPLYYALQGVFYEVLLELKVWSIRNIWESFSYMRALGYRKNCFYVGYDLVQTLLKSGADVNHINKKGFSPLQISIFRQKPPLVKLLLRHGANACYGSKDSLTAFQSAYGFYEYKIFLLMLNSCLNTENDSDFKVLNFRRKRSIFDRNFDRHFAEHVTKLKAAEIVVHESFLCEPSENVNEKDLLRFRRMCDKEVEVLKKAYFADSNVSFYSILKSTPSELVSLTEANNEKILKKRAWKSKYPIYGKLIDWQLIKAQELN